MSVLEGAARRNYTGPAAVQNPNFKPTPAEAAADGPSCLAKSDFQSAPSTPQALKRSAAATAPPGAGAAYPRSKLDLASHNASPPPALKRKAAATVPPAAGASDPRRKPQAFNREALGTRLKPSSAKRPQRRPLVPGPPSPELNLQASTAALPEPGRLETAAPQSKQRPAPVWGGI